MRTKKRALCWAFLAILLLGTLSGCGGQKAEEALDAALSALVSGDSQNVPLLGLDGSPVTGFENEGLAQVISSRLQYEIKEVSAKGSKAAATVKITAPDTPGIIREVLDGMGEYDEEAFIARMAEKLEGSAPSAVFTVEVELQRVDGIWCLVPSAELSNAMTGGLLQAYVDQVRQIQSELMGGNEG